MNGEDAAKEEIVQNSLPPERLRNRDMAGSTLRAQPISEPARVHETITINKVSNGFIVRVGCRTLVSMSWHEVNAALEHYWRNPREAEKIYCK